MTNPTLPPPGPSPSLALLLAAVGGGMILGARPTRGERTRPFFTLAGMALLGAAAHRPLADALRHAGTRRRSADLRFSFVVERRVEEVFAFCANFENFPRFIGALRQVRDNGDGRSHWCASTPSGGEIEWNATTTKFVTNSVIGWQSVANSPVETAGLLRFSPDGESTCVKVAINYRVFDGSMTDALAALATPRRGDELEADIRRMDAHMDETVNGEPTPPNG
jgi:uncharacterized membrane protein